MKVALLKHFYWREKHTWALRCRSHVQEEVNLGLIFPNTDSLHDSSLLSFPRFSYLPFSRRVSLYPEPMWWAHVPEGPSAQSLTFSATHIVCLRWTDEEFWQEGELSACRVGGSWCRGIFQDLLGLCWHPVWLCYQLQLGIGGYLGGILSCGVVLFGFGSQMYTWNVHLIFVEHKELFEVYGLHHAFISISLWNMIFIPEEFRVE